MSQKTLEILVPVLNEEQSIKKFFTEVSDHLPQEYAISYSFLFIDDGSTDNSWSVVRALSNQHDHIQGIRLSRNFGKESAIRVGLESSHADAVVTMDCDLQHPPALVGKMIEEWFERGTPIVEAQKSSRQPESIFMRLFATLFYKLYELLNGKRLEGASDFKLLDRIVINELKKMPEKILFFRGAVDWLGFQKKVFDFTPAPRFSGTSGWHPFPLAKYAVNSLFCFSFRPLYFVLALYLIYGFSALGLIAFTLYSWASNQSAEGFPTTYLIILLSFSLLFLSLVILTGYITVIFTEIKGRQHYVVSEYAKR